MNQSQQKQFAALQDCYRVWNEKINVISRKDIDQLYLHHVLHSLAIAKFVSLTPGSKVMDPRQVDGGFPAEGLRGSEDAPPIPLTPLQAPRPAHRM